MLSFALDDALSILSRTPRVAAALLTDLPAPWLHGRQADGTWTPAEVLVHLIEGEKALWVPRMRVILSGDPAARFPAFVRDAHFERATAVPVNTLLEEFATLRSQSLAELQSLPLSSADLARTAQHPEFGAVTLAQLLATWTAHDLAHCTQITRTMARQYVEAVGPWRQYMSVLRA